ncbi:OmpA family protein [Altericroceibacterium xinjiangense]|uniref:OmpA family protein n=1 Tax=Altericroceibacterium xinjiangense TaxID=762261 RepID=UPI0013DFF603|nr:OmpA family protein [Altericroceibacterium xinjiangense]
MIRIASAGMGLAALLAFTGCDRDEPQGPEAEPSVVPSPLPTQTAAASIIRPDIIPEPIVEDLPPRPIERTIPFPDGGTELSETAVARLQEVRRSPQVAEGWPIVLRGHTDSAGADRANLAASKERAEAVADWLTEQGLAEERITTIAMGEQNPIAPNANPDGTPNEEGRARNRRVTINVAPPESESSREEQADPGQID